MKFLDLTGLQYFYEKYLRPLKNAAFKDVANDLTTSIDGFVLDARQGTVLDEKKLDKSKVINNALTTEEGFALDARQGKVLKDEIDELNGKMTEIGVEQSYSENGWTVSYRNIGANRIYYVASKTVSSIEAGANMLEIAALPFKVAFSKYLNLVMNVSGTPVGYGYARIVPTSGSGNTSAMYRHCTGYGNAVSMLVYGELVIQ